MHVRSDLCAPPGSEGKTVRCPGCNGTIIVPGADPLRADLPADDPLGIGSLASSTHSLPLGSSYSAGEDSGERLARQLAWIAGSTVALMAFAMFITFLIYRFPKGAAAGGKTAGRPG